MILGDDDFLSSDYVENMVSLFFNDSTCKAAFGRNNIVDKNENILATLESNYGRYIQGVEYVILWMSFSKLIQQHSVIMMFSKRDDMIQAGGFPDFAMAQHADNALFISITLQGTIGYDHKACYSYRVYPESYGNKHVIEVGIATSQLMKYFEEKIQDRIITSFGDSTLKQLKKHIKKASTWLYYQRLILYNQPDTFMNAITKLKYFPNWLEKYSYFPKFLFKFIQRKIFKK
jgi:hypothetical protein